MSNVVGLFETREQAQRAVEALKASGYRAEDLSIVMRDPDRAADVAEDTDVDVTSGAAAGVVGGSILGGLGGLLVGIGALAIPGLGPIVAAGPLAATLAGGALGAATGGILGALLDAGLSRDEAEHYQTGVERGGILLMVNAPEGREAEVRSILRRCGLKDLDYHRGRWESDPNFTYDINRSEDMTTHRTEDRDKAQVDAKAGGAAAGGVAGAAIGAAAGGPVGAGIGAVAGAAAGGLAGAAADYNAAEPGFRRDWESTHRDTHTWEQAGPAYRYGFESFGKPEYHGRGWDEVRSDLKSHWRNRGHFDDLEPMVRSAWEHRAQRMLDSGREAVVPVVEEEVKVGKRKVETGGVKVQTKITERPVEEKVHLHEERVKVERRPANRPAAAGDVAFQEGTLELRETVEEAVVSKTPRVVEEVAIKKEGKDRTETVRDTARRTDVEVHEAETPVREVEVTKETRATNRKRT
jgi:stress response protein YsnF/uncharacterized membrane protein